MWHGTCWCCKTYRPRLNWWNSTMGSMWICDECIKIN